jgi:hypothetical protein
MLCLALDFRFPAPQCPHLPLHLLSRKLATASKRRCQTLSRNSSVNSHTYPTAPQNSKDSLISRKRIYINVGS